MITDFIHPCNPFDIVNRCIYFLLPENSSELPSFLIIVTVHLLRIHYTLMVKYFLLTICGMVKERYLRRTATVESAMRAMCPQSQQRRASVALGNII
jgi:hypothetical protein